MRILENLSIKVKLIALTAFLAAMLLLSGGTVIFGMQQSQSAMAVVYKEHVTAINTLNEIRGYQYKILQELVSARLEQTLSRSRPTTTGWTRMPSRSAPY